MRRWIPLWLAASWLAMAGPDPACVHAQTVLDGLLGRSAPAEAPTEPTGADLEARRAEIAQRLSVARRQLETQPKSDANDALTGEVDRGKRLDLLLAQQQAAQQKHVELEANKAQAQERLTTLREQGLSDSPPYSFARLDGLRDELDTLEQRYQSAGAAIDAAVDSLVGAKTQADQAHRKLRQAEQSPRVAEGKTPPLPKKLLELDAQIADAQVDLLQAQLANERVNKELLELEITEAREKIDLVSPQVVLSDKEQQEKRVELAKEEDDLKAALAEAETRLDYLEHRLTESESSTELAAAPEAVRAAELEARQTARAAQQQYVNLLNQQLERLSQRSEAWTRRFAAQNNTASREQLRDWASKARESIEQLATEDRLQDLKIDEARKQLADVEKRLQAVGPEDELLGRSLNEQRRVYQELINHYGESITSIELTRRVQQRLLTEIESGRMTVGERFALALEYVRSVWNYELVVSDGQPVTVSMVAWGIVLLAAGLVVSRWFSRALGNRFLPRFGVHENAAAALQSLSFYTMVVLTALLALRWVNVPLTLFTFLGGAVAIGVGFGSQNLVNNFISGLILLAERPIRVGDVIEIGNLVGSVEKIGRAARVFARRRISRSSFPIVRFSSRTSSTGPSPTSGCDARFPSASPTVRPRARWPAGSRKPPRSTARRSSGPSRSYGLWALATTRSISSSISGFRSATSPSGGASKAICDSSSTSSSAKPAWSSPSRSATSTSTSPGRSRSRWSIPAPWRTTTRRTRPSSAGSTPRVSSRAWRQICPSLAPGSAHCGESAVSSTRPAIGMRIASTVPNRPTLTCGRVSAAAGTSAHPSRSRRRSR